jgi:predicted transcriptional regulator
MVPVRSGGGVRGFGELEAVVMDRLWSRDEPATVREILDELTPDRKWRTPPS